MPFFIRKFMTRPKPAWDQEKYEYEDTIRLCYQWKTVTLALCSFQKFQCFNSKYSSEIDHKPFFESDRKFRGVVHEKGQFKTHVACEVEVLTEGLPKDYIGEFVLAHISQTSNTIRREEQPLELSVTLLDSTAKLTESLIDGLRDAALSRFRFMHIELECLEPTAEELEKALSDMRERGYAATRNILSVKMWPKIELENAPSWARQTDQ